MMKFDTIQFVAGIVLIIAVLLIILKLVGRNPSAGGPEEESSFEKILPNEGTFSDGFRDLQVSGHVINSKGKGLADVCVSSLFDARSEYEKAQAKTTTNSQGDFKFTCLADCSFKVFNSNSIPIYVKWHGDVSGSFSLKFDKEGFVTEYRNYLDYDVIEHDKDAISFDVGTITLTEAP